MSASGRRSAAPPREARPWPAPCIAKPKYPETPHAPSRRHRRPAAHPRLGLRRAGHRRRPAFGQAHLRDRAARASPAGSSSRSAAARGTATGRSAAPSTPRRSRALAEAELAGDGGQVRFRIARDAGTLDCEGVARRGRGTGECSFSPTRSFAATLAERGIGPPTADEQFSMAMHDIGLDYVDEVRPPELRHADARPSSPRRAITASPSITCAAWAATAIGSAGLRADPDARSWGHARLYRRPRPP